MGSVFDIWTYYINKCEFASILSTVDKLHVAVKASRRGIWSRQGGKEGISWAGGAWAEFQLGATQLMKGTEGNARDRGNSVFRAPVVGQ